MVHEYTMKKGWKTSVVLLFLSCDTRLSCSSDRERLYASSVVLWRRIKSHASFVVSSLPYFM
jgi:hypothetical protein